MCEAVGWGTVPDYERLYVCAIPSSVAFIQWAQGASELYQISVTETKLLELHRGERSEAGKYVRKPFEGVLMTSETRFWDKGDGNEEQENDVKALK